MSMQGLCGPSPAAAPVTLRAKDTLSRARCMVHNEPLPMSNPPVIQVSGIRKTYGSTVAVDDVSFEVNQGEIFGLIGPNGAGKTTTMECVEGLRRPDRGTISVLSLDPFRDVYTLQNRIGVQLQAGAAPEADQGVGSGRSLGLALPESREWRAAARAARAGRQAERVVHDAVGRPEAAAVHRARAHQRSRGGVPRRADHRARPAGAPRHLGSGARHPRARQDRVPDHAPDGGGRAVVRPRGDHRPRPHHRHRHAGRAGRPSLPRAHRGADDATTRQPESASRRFARVEAVTRTGSRFTIRGRGDDLVTEVIHCVSEHRIRVTDFRTVLPTLEDVFLKLTGHSIRD